MREPTPVPPLVFGVYPGGEAGTDTGMAEGRPGDPAAIEGAIARLQGGRAPFVLRVYERFSDAAHPSPYPTTSPPGYEQYLAEGRRLDAVLMFQSKDGDVPAFVDWVRAHVRRLAPQLFSVQVTEEASFTHGPDAIDGSYPRVREALVEGVQAARDELDALAFARVPVGFSTTPTFGPEAEFWGAIRDLGGQPFLDALGYVALDFFPDVFRRAAPDGQPGDVRDSVHLVLRTLRETWMPAAGIAPSTPIHIGEHGWPTDSTRPAARQAEVLETVIRAVHEHRGTYNVARYTLFALRDANSSVNSFWQQFGVMRHDYTPKPAFEVYRRLVAELGGA
jgi:hypothetical protein